MNVSLSEQLDRDIETYLHKVFGTYFSSLDTRFAVDIRSDVIVSSNFIRGDYNEDDISIALQRVTLGRMGHPDWRVYSSGTEEDAMKQNVKVNRAIHFRPASSVEAGLFYSEHEENKDKELGTVGHVRIDFGSSGKGFYHSWWPHNGDRFNTEEFKGELQEMVDALRADGPLQDLASMRAYCYRNGGQITEDGRSFGYIAETKNYRYCLRCTPSPGDYQGYLYCYDLRQQQIAQSKPVGQVTYSSGERMEFTDAASFLQTIREELPYMATTGFRYKLLTDDPDIQKVVDDILLDFTGEENPRRACNYGLTEKGIKAMQDVANQNLPHTYEWFVITDCNTSGEYIFRNLTLEEAIHTYLDSDRPEKRIGVTKDGIATVDLVWSHDGEQKFFTDHLKLNSFKSDSEVAAAVEKLQSELEQNTPQQGMTIGGLS